MGRFAYPSLVAFSSYFFLPEFRTPPTYIFCLRSNSSKDSNSIPAFYGYSSYDNRGHR